MPGFDYQKIKNSFNWQDVKAELNYEHNPTKNIGWYCSDRICDLGIGNKTALIWENALGQQRTFSFEDLRVLSNTMAAYLQEQGIQAGDRVCLFMDKIPELYIGFLGILKIGAISQPLFSAFGDDALLVRLENAKTKAIITQRKHIVKVRRILERTPFLQSIIILDNNGKPLEAREVALELDSLAPITDFFPFAVEEETPSVLHYTSGTTGTPKGVKHVHQSLLSQYITAKWVIDLRPDDIYWCTADPGWVTGTSYGIIGPWSLGITQCVLDKGFSADSWYDFIQRQKITNWYTAPTAIRSLMRAGEDVVKKYDLSSLRYLSSVGEPLNPEAVLWGEKVLGKAFHDTYWQTETGAIMIANYPDLQIKPGSMGKPFPGITAAILDDRTFEPISHGHQTGLIGFKPGWPSMFRTYWDNDEIYQAKFHNGWYIPGDKAKTDNDGYFWFIGRDDDVINTAGHLVSPFEVESALLQHPAISESAVVAKPDLINMEVVKAFVRLHAEYAASNDLKLNIMNFIRKKLSPLAMPQEIEFVNSLPKTKSGKIMRRLLHAKEWGEDIGDVSTLDDELN